MIRLCWAACFFFFATFSARADRIEVPWISDTAIVGVVISVGSRGFRFRRGCNGPAINVPWRRGDMAAAFVRTTKCQEDGGLSFTVGQGFGGECADWRQGNYFSVRVIEKPGVLEDKGSWWILSRLQFRRDRLIAYAPNHGRQVTIPLQRVGNMRAKQGYCAD